MIRLQTKDAEWKKKTIILLDGAAYHRSKETRNYLANHGVKVVIGGPYAFAAAPIEYFFSGLKCTDLNPEGLKSGKK